jgi:hypothetical protein
MKKARFPLNQLKTLQSERNLAHERQDVEIRAATREATKSVNVLPKQNAVDPTRAMGFTRECSDLSR